MPQDMILVMPRKETDLQTFLEVSVGLGQATSPCPSPFMRENSPLSLPWVSICNASLDSWGRSPPPWWATGFTHLPIEQNASPHPGGVGESRWSWPSRWPESGGNYPCLLSCSPGKHFAFPSLAFAIHEVEKIIAFSQCCWAHDVLTGWRSTWKVTHKKI